MDRLTTIALRIGEWRVSPSTGQLSKDGETHRLEARTMRLLMYLANRAGETVSIEELLDQVWSGVVVTQDSVYQAVTSLRRLLGDDARQPKYIATVPRLGYRLVAAVSPWSEDTDAAAIALPAETPIAGAKRRWQWVAAGAVLLVAILSVAGWRAFTAPEEKSMAVLPFLDITSQDMNEEYFADGMTEELINRLSKLPGFKVSSPTDSFFFKDQQLPAAEIGRQLHVAYLLDGSLRESGDTLRVTTRLIRASDGAVIWTENYDQPKADKLKVQDEIANQVAAAIRTSVQ